MDALLHEPAFAAVAALPYAFRIFNTGVFVFEPSVATASALLRLSQEHGRRWEHDGSVINHYYSQWRSLPFGYNMGKRILSANRRLWNRVEIAVVRIACMIISRAYYDYEYDDVDDDSWRDYANRCTMSGGPSRGRP